MVRSKPPQTTAGELASLFGGEVRGEVSLPVERFAGLLEASPEEASFLANGRLAHQLEQTRAGLVVLQPEFSGRGPTSRTEILCANPYLFFAQAAQLLQRRRRQLEVTQTEVHPSAVVHPTAQLGERVRIGPLAVIEAEAQIGDDSDIGAGCQLGLGVRLGAGCLIHPRVCLAEGTVVGDRVVIQSGAVLGSDGFGFAPRPDRSWEKIPQTGGVWVGDDVEIGANTVIDRGTLSNTRIGRGVKLDNLIQVAHNVEIGEHTAIAGCVGIAGSAKIGAYCQIGGAAGILGHLTIADGTVIGPFSLVMSSIETAGKYVGIFPLQPERDWEKSATLVRRLPRLREQIRDLQAK